MDAERFQFAQCALPSVFIDGRYQVHKYTYFIAKLYCRPRCGGAAASRPYLAESGEPMQGWWSPAERELAPAYAFCYARTGQATGSFATLLSFGETLSALPQGSRVNTSGRKALLRWIDEVGQHQIDLERPAEGELLVAYTVSKGKRE